MNTTTSDQMTTAPPEAVLASRWTSALAGMLGGAAALAVGEFVASLSAPKPGPVIAVSNRVIDYAPVWFINFGKDVFGLADKPALIIGTLIIAMVVAALLGVASIRRPLAGVIGIAAFGGLGAFAIGTDAQGGWGFALIVSALAALGGILVLRFMLAAAHAQAQTAAGNFVAPTPKVGDTTGTVIQPSDPAVTRRGFIGWAGIAAGTVGAAVVGANALRNRANVAEARAAIDLASPDITVLEAAEIDVAAVVAKADAGPIGSLQGITPLVVPNEDFYRIDTATLVPQVDPADWTLTIKGMVENPITLTYEQLLARSTEVKPVTLSCVSNPIGGPFVGNAVWQGVPLSELLDEVKPLPGATQIRSASVDGWDCGFPTELAYDGRTAMVAIGMNGEPLPVINGFPARVVVSGLYGYVSATKWLKEIELTTLEGFDGYWMDKGWAKDGPIKTQSRIDIPRHNPSQSPGVNPDVQPGVPTKIAGVAWAPNKGIEKVEVRVNDEEWRVAELGESLGKNSWRQWAVEWTPAEGRYIISVRATDATGETQTEVVTRSDPDGATGWHTIALAV